MKLSKAERLILANQFELLSMKDNNYLSKKTCENYSTILLQGYELLYDDIFSGMDETVSSEKCRFALDVLSMYRIISSSYSNLESTSLTKEDIAFKGFDGNNEDEYHFAKFFINDMNRFKDLTDNEFMEFNSHSTSIPRYERELDVYNDIISYKKEENRFDHLSLTEKEISNILSV